MRKIKKINGYLVVRFNDREKRLNEGTGLGSFGVIDAEQYTGVLDIDRDLMEFDGADTLEEAIDQARGLEAEQDVDEPQIKITIVKESDTDCTEEEVDPVTLFNAEKSTLKAVNENCTVPGLGDLITTQRLYGYTRALTDLGVVEISDERFQVDLALPPNCAPLILSHEQHKDLQRSPALSLKNEQIPTDELEQAESALKRMMQLASKLTKSDEQSNLLRHLSTFGRLIEKERLIPTSENREKLEYIAIGLISGSVHVVTIPMAPNLIQAEFIDTVRRKLIARFVFEKRFGGYYLELTEFLAF
ncbi:hypothetical protein D7X33_24930 [Butyricicoccus sp. 1XD8-22]|nr:hypothetical protein D7X33_24930 [Butyricicoccus sp. 1XD8-22]